MKAKKIKQRSVHQVMFPNAIKLSKQTDLRENTRYNCLVDGSFIFGDYLEALMVNQNIGAESMAISTLSLSQNNVDSLYTLLEKDYIKDLTLIVSDYFYSHERNKLIKYIYERLDYKDRFQLSVARTHAKITYFKTYGGKKVVIHGSANLRSADNIEQFTIEIDDELYNFYNDFFSKVIDKYKTINKSLTNKQIRNLIN